MQKTNCKKAWLPPKKKHKKKKKSGNNLFDNQEIKQK